MGTKPLFTVSDQSFVNDFIKLAGGENIAAGSGTGMYSREEVLRQNPDVIIITAMGLAGEKEKQKWQQIRELSAVKKGQIYVIDPYKIGSPTPQTFAAILAEIAVMIHPQIELED